MNHVTLDKLLSPLGFMLAALVIVSATLQWPLAINYAFTALMFAAFLGARAADRRNRRAR
jgi:hypothetical protein